MSKPQSPAWTAKHWNYLLAFALVLAITAPMLSQNAESAEFFIGENITMGIIAGDGMQVYLTTPTRTYMYITKPGEQLSFIAREIGQYRFEVYNESTGEMIYSETHDVRQPLPAELYENLQLDKIEYYVGESVRINVITNIENYKMRIVTANKTFETIGQQNNLTFVVRNEGLHIVSMLDSSDMEIVSQTFVARKIWQMPELPNEQENITSNLQNTSQIGLLEKVNLTSNQSVVVNASFDNTSSNISDAEFTVTLDKYTLLEEEQLSIMLSQQTDDIVISNAISSYSYSGERTGYLTFIPMVSGEYNITAKLD